VIVSDNLPLLFSPPQNTNQPTKIMKNTLHTPGPWKHDSTWGIIKHGKTEICALHSGNLANANLIASAPDLLLALETLLSDRSCPSFLTLDEWHNTHPEFRSTLRKAKGEA
jgi:hypothetical protein